MDSFTGAFSAMKDRAVEASAKSMLNRKIEQFGTVTRFELDSKQKRLFLEVTLKGEVSPVVLEVGAYSVVERDNRAFIVVQQVTASREWVSIALNQYVVGREFPLPESARMAL